MLRELLAFAGVLMLSGVCCLALLRGGSSGGPPEDQDQPAWAGVFPRLDGYVATYEKPVVAKGGASYSQKAIYGWSGGRYEVLEITLARDPALAGKYSADALKKAKNPPVEREIGTRKAWLWEFKREAGKLDQVLRRLVVVLDRDKAIVLEQKGSGANLEDVARKFDFGKVQKALAQPPGK
jgi:hypothetical protein